MVAKLTRLLEDYLAHGRSTPGAKQPNDVNLAITKKSSPAPK
ncbi:hypothetical protein LBMAG56_08030 [Verrucomicrobiota bacterium]|nr:hypothetical protein LBMAG56_08030 [Verrucomicrobiota bacterium]